MVRSSRDARAPTRRSMPRSTPPACATRRPCAFPARRRFASRASPRRSVSRWQIRWPIRTPSRSGGRCSRTRTVPPRLVEIANLPQAPTRSVRAALDAEGFGALPPQALLDGCGRTLADASTATTALRAELVARAEVPDDYDDTARTVGLYPLTRIGYAAGVRFYEQSVRDAFVSAPVAIPPSAIAYAPAPAPPLSPAEAAASLRDRARIRSRFPFRRMSTSTGCSRCTHRRSSSTRAARTTGSADRSSARTASPRQRRRRWCLRAPRTRVSRTGCCCNSSTRSGFRSAHPRGPATSSPAGSTA